MRTRERLTVALIDDEQDFLAIIQSWLRPLYDVLPFVSAEELLSRGETINPDLIISDVRMPGLNGFMLVESLRSHPRLGKVPVIFLTGIDSDEGYLLGMEAGANAYMTKPVERMKLLERIRELLAKRPARVPGP